jgi:hypothetical protein
MISNLRKKCFFRNLRLIFCRKFQHPRNLGPKTQKYWNLILRDSGDALEEAVLLYAKYIPKFQLLMARTPLKRGSYKFFWKP